MALRSLSMCLRANSSSRQVRIWMNFSARGSDWFFSSPGVVEDVLTTRASWQGKEISIWVLKTWDHHHWMPVKYGILIYVSHLGSSSLPCWATRWTRSGTSRGTSTGKETQPILAVFFRDINLFGHVECLNGLRGGHAPGHREPGDGQPQQGHVPHHDQGV